MANEPNHIPINAFDSFTTSTGAINNICKKNMYIKTHTHKKKKDAKKINNSKSV